MKTKIAALIVTGCLLASPKLLAATIGAANGGTGISADKAANAVSPAWTSLGTMTIQETGGNKGELVSGTIILSAPSGFEFNSAQKPGITFNANKDLTGASVAITSNTLTITLVGTATANVDMVTVGGTGTNALQVRPLLGTPLATGNITRTGGTLSLSGVTGTTSFGALAEVVGNAAKLSFTQDPASATVGSPFGTQPVVRTRDQFDAFSSAGLPATLNVTVSLAAGTGPLVGTTTMNIGTSGGNGTVTFTNLQVNSEGTDKQLSVSGSPLGSGLSGVFTVVGGASQTIDSFPTIATKTYGDAPFPVSATASSGLPVTFSIQSGPATVTSNVVTITGAGDVTIRASQDGDASWNSTFAEQTFTVNKGTPAITWSNPEPIAVGVALSEKQLNASSPVAGTFDYTPAAGSLLSAGDDQVLSVLFTPTDTDNYPNPTASFLIVVIAQKATPTISWSTPADITYGTALSSTQLNASASVAGSYTYNPTNGTVLNAGNGQTLSVTFVPANTNAYNEVTTNVVINVLQATPVITWSNPADITYGDLLSGTQLNASASVAGTLTYNPTNGTQLNAGAGQILSVTFTPDDSTNYASTSTNVVINVAKATPVVTWSNPADIIYGTALSGTQLNASANIGGSFTYTPDTNVVLNAGTQSLSVSFVPADTANYNSTNASVSLNVLKAATTITWSNPSDITYGTALSGTQLNATASVAGTLVYSPDTNAVLNAGTNTLSVTFTPTDSANYLGTNANVSLVVNKATPVITWNNPADIIYGTALSGTQLNATADVAGGTFTYNPTNGAVLNAGNSQVLSVDYVPADTANYNNASATASINVLKATPQITWANPASISYGTLLSTNELNATANVAGSFAYTPDVGVLLNAGAGQTLSVSFTPSDAANYNSTSTNASITVLKVTPTINWSTPSGIVYGTPLSGAQLNATASVAGTLTYNPTNGAVLNAGNQTLNVSFVPDDTTNYNNANGSVTLAVAKAPVTITWNNPSDINYGTALSGTQLNATASTAGSFAYSPASGVVLGAGNTQTLSVNFTPSSANYSNATATASINVLPVPLLVKANDTNRVVGASNPTFTATYTGFVNGDTAASLTTPVSFSTTADNLSSAGFYDITPSGAASANYTISYVSGTLTVSPASIVVSTATGNWSSSSTWLGGVVPTAIDNVVIAPGTTVTVDVAAECFSLTLSNTVSAIPALTISATKSLVVGAGSGLVTIGQNVTPNNGMLNNVLNVAGSLSCGNVSMIARRSVNNDRIHAFLRLSNAGAVVTVTNNITLDRNTTTGGLLAQVDFTAAGLLKLGGGFVSVGQGGTLNAGAGTVEYNAAGNQTINAFTYNNLTLSGSGIKTGSAAVTIGATGTLSLKDTASYAGVTPTYTSGATLFYGRTGAQVTGTELTTLPPAVWNLSISNAAGVTLSQSVSVPGTLRLISGALVTAGNTVTANGTTTRTSGYVLGNLKKSFGVGAGVARTFEVGLATGYNPVALTIANVSTAGSLTVSANAGDHSAIGSSILDASKSVNVNWTINTDGVLGFDNYSSTFNYNASDLDAGASPSLLILGDYSSSAWSYPAVASRTATSLTVNGLTSFSDFQLAENASKTVSTITWGTPSDIVYGTALDTNQLNASSSTTGTLTYSPASGTVLDAGNSQTLTVTLAPADPANYTAATNTVTINVNKANLSVTTDNYSRFFGEANPTFTGTVTGVVNGDPITASYSSTATPATASGVYTITATLNDPSTRLGNYNVSNPGGSLTIYDLPQLQIDSGYLLKVVGPTNVIYTIQATDALGTTWQPIGTTTLGGSGLQEFQDAAPTNAVRLYRIAQ